MFNKKFYQITTILVFFLLIGTIYSSARNKHGYGKWSDVLKVEATL